MRSQPSPVPSAFLQLPETSLSSKEMSHVLVERILPYGRVKPHVEHLVRVPFQRDWGAPFQVTCDTTRSEALLDPSPSNMARVRRPRS